jgi:dimethylamine monooxygenase subunit A
VSDYIYGPPTDGKPFKLAMGLRTLEPSLWLEGGADLVEQLNERSSLIADAEQVIYGALDGFDEETNYFVSLIAENIKEFHGGNYEVTPTHITHRESGFKADLASEKVLLELTRVIAEDLCVLKKIDGSWTLIAGAVLFPSRWRLSEKLGKSLDRIHAPVPGYGNALQPYMTATFDKISPDRPVWRKNWSLHSTPDLHQPESIHEARSPEDYWWRTERQTLTRSNASEAILFTIRNRAEPLSWIMKRADEAAAFAQTLSSIAPETIEYKGLTSSHQDIVRALMLGV